MKPSQAFGISLLFAVMLSNWVIAEVRINEIECNPFGTDAKNEWMELYSPSEVDLEGWRVENSEGKIMELEGRIKGHLIINFSSQWLDNTEETINLYEGEDLIDSAQDFDDSDNDNRTWQYCDGDWSYLEDSKGKKNDCDEEENTDNDENVEENSYLEAEWEETDILNTGEFEIEVTGYDLLNKEYDLQIYIYDDEKKVISERYSQESKEWKSGNFFISKIFSGPSKATETIELRIKESYSDYFGDANLAVKLRQAETFTIVAEEEYPIEILEERKESNKEEEEEEEEEEEITTNFEEETNSKTTSKVIKLGKQESQKNVTKEAPKDERTENRVLYESRSEIMKKYAIYGLNAVLIAIVIYLLINFKKKEN